MWIDVKKSNNLSLVGIGLVRAHVSYARGVDIIAKLFENDHEGRLLAVSCIELKSCGLAASHPIENHKSNLVDLTNLNSLQPKRSTYPKATPASTLYPMPNSNAQDSYTITAGIGPHPIVLTHMICVQRDIIRDLKPSHPHL